MTRNNNQKQGVGFLPLAQTGVRFPVHSNRRIEDLFTSQKNVKAFDALLPVSKLAFVAVDKGEEEEVGGKWFSESLPKKSE